MLSNEDGVTVDANTDSLAAFAELSIGQLYILPEAVQDTMPIMFGAYALNQGGADSGPFAARFTLDDGETRDVQFPSIAAGASRWEEWMHDPLRAGVHTIAVQLDPDNQVQEGNKFDNMATLPFHVDPAFITDTADGTI